MAETVRNLEPRTAGGLYSTALAALAALLPPGASSPEAAFLRAHTAGADRPAVAFPRDHAADVNRPEAGLPRAHAAGLDRPEAAFLRAHAAGLDRPEAVFPRADAAGIASPDPIDAAPSPDLPDPIDAALLELAEQLPLSRIELLSVVLAAAVEMDVMCGRAVAHLQSPVGGSRPTLGLLAAAFAEFDTEGDIVERILTGAAVGSGLLHLLNEGAPLAERPAAVPIPLCLALTGRDADWLGATLGLEGMPETPLPHSVLAEASRQARGLSGASQNFLVLRGGAAAEARTVAAEIASALYRRPLFLDMEPAGSSPKAAPTLAGLGPFLLLRGLIPVFCYDPGPGERRAVPALPYYAGPVLALCSHDGSIEARGDSPAAWRIGVPPREERRQLWQVAIGNDRLASQLASDYRHGSGRIAQLGRLVRQECLLDNRAEPAFADIAAASWVGQGSGLEALAQPLPDLIPDEALVAGSLLRGELARLLLRCRRRESLIEGLGASAVARYRPGVRALFTGQSGTGKTLAASWLATQLGLPLYRADLAAVTSKYIGETEKNLAQLLGRAEQAGIILLFDEADSLFGKRTEVKESNDRFANAQTNYLLQRIETFDGIALLTSNSRARFDPAFCRRLDMIVEFPLPDAEERRLLWLSHLGARHQLSPRELNQLAAAADLAGGHIRNAVLTAAVLAQAANRPIEYQDVFVGLEDEYRKLGRQVPQALTRRA